MPESRPLRIAALVKQVPASEAFHLDSSGRLQREGLPLEMNPFCRRAVSEGSTMARETDGRCTVFTLGPPAADDVLREAVAWGADDAIHLCDPTFAGSDTLATAKVLAAALRREGPFDLILLGRNSVDGDTGQVGPQLAALLDLPFASAVRTLELSDGQLTLGLQHDDGTTSVSVALPAILGVAERLCEPCKVDPDGRSGVAAERIRRLTAADLGSGPWGEKASATRVGIVRDHPHTRAACILRGAIDEQVRDALSVLDERIALTHPGGPTEMASGRPGIGAVSELAEEAVRARAAASQVENSGLVAVVAEPGRTELTAELLGAAFRLAHDAAGEEGRVVQLVPEVEVGHQRVLPEDVASAIVSWSRGHDPWVLLAPSTDFGREVAGRVSAMLGAGLVGDAIALDVIDGVFVAAKPAFSGAQIADITCVGTPAMATVRPGVLPAPDVESDDRRRTHPTSESVTLARANRGRISVLDERRDDDVRVLARAATVVGVGSAVQPEEYPELSELCALLGAELGATRKVTDNGWAPRSRQIGITGRSISPRLYVAIGVGGKWNHMVGVRGAGTILAINRDPEAPVFTHADVGIVGDWHQVVPALAAALRSRKTAGN